MPSGLSDRKRARIDGRLRLASSKGNQENWNRPAPVRSTESSTDSMQRFKLPSNRLPSNRYNPPIVNPTGQQASVDKLPPIEDPGPITTQYLDWINREKLEYAAFTARLASDQALSNNATFEVITVESIGAWHLTRDREILPILLTRNYSSTEEIFLCFRSTHAHPQIHIYTRTIAALARRNRKEDEAIDQEKILAGTRIALYRNSPPTQLARSKMYTRFKVLESARG